MPNPISDIFKNFMHEKTPSVVGVDIGSSAIKVVQIKRKKGKAVLETYGELALGPYAGTEIGRSTNLPPEKIAEAILDIFKESNITTTNSGVSIPMRSSMVSLIKIPSTNAKQIDQMVPIEARKYIPVPIAEVALSWSVIPTDRDMTEEDREKNRNVPMSEVLMVAVHNDVIGNYKTLAEKANLNVGFFEIEMFSAIRAVIDIGDPASVMIFDMGAGVTKVYIVEHGVIKESHMINRGSQDITLGISTALSVTIDYAERLKRNYGSNGEREDKEIAEIITITTESVFNEANSVLLNYQKKNNKNVTKIILTGGGVMLKGFLQKAVIHFQTETVYGDPFSKVEIPAFLREILKATGSEFSVAMGLALRKLQEMD
jgi:type IV pilus assembly protein PilM